MPDIEFSRCIAKIYMRSLSFIIKRIADLSSKCRLCVYVLVTFLMFCIGYCLIGIVDFLGGSYLAVYFVGLIVGQEFEWFENKSSFILAIILLVVGGWGTKVFYANRVNGIHIPEGLDRLVPKLAMNPPNLSVILYSMGIILLIKNLARFISEDNKMLKPFLCVIELVGKYSLDIFLWHILIQNMLMRYIVIDNIWIKRSVYYLAMIGLPIVVRIVYEKIKLELVKELEGEKYE